jgi:hypothetical protein
MVEGPSKPDLHQLSPQAHLGLRVVDLVGRMDVMLAVLAGRGTCITLDLQFVSAAVSYYSTLRCQKNQVCW